MNRFRSSERHLQLICRASRRQHRKSEIARQEKSWSVRKVCTARGTGRLGSKWQSIDLITRNCGLYLRKSLACCRLAWPTRRRRSDVSRTPAEGLLLRGGPPVPVAPSRRHTPTAAVPWSHSASPADSPSAAASTSAAFLHRG